MSRRADAVLAALAVAVAALFVATVAAGSVTIPLPQVVTVLAGRAPTDPVWSTIVTDVRLPRALTALLAGAALGVGGLQMQTLFRNPLADPFILGVSSGASLGVALVVLTAGQAGTTLVGGLGLAASVGVAGAAAVGAGVTTAAVLAVSRRVASPATVLIIGLMAGYVTAAVVSVLIHSGVGGVERVRAYIAWGFGSFASTTWSELTVLVPCIAAGLALAGAMTKQLNALLLGDRYAASMGLRVRGARVLVICGASLLAGVTTAFCGPIAFVGVAAPHVARAVLRTSDHRALVPGCLLVGGAVALAAGLAAQVPGSDATLPLNAVTSLIGAPVVVGVLLRLRRSAQAVVP
ncbi:iron ABC transporter permease [soil metagenome]